MAHQGFYTEWIAKDDGKIQIEGRGFPLFLIFFVFHVVCLSLVFNPPEWIAKDDGKIKRGEGVPHPFLSFYFSRGLLVIGFQPT